MAAELQSQELHNVFCSKRVNKVVK